MPGKRLAQRLAQRRASARPLQRAAILNTDTACISPPACGCRLIEAELPCSASVALRALLPARARTSPARQAVTASRTPHNGRQDGTRRLQSR